MLSSARAGRLLSTPWPMLLAALASAPVGCVPRGAAFDDTAAGPRPAGAELATAGDRPPGATAGSASLSPALGEVLEAHNRVRADHCARPLEWSPELASAAQAWADELRAAGCAFAHSDSTRYGENLFFAAPSSPDSGLRAVESWASERSDYDFARPGFSMRTGHFTQVVWRGSREVGCGTAQCNGGDLWVCNYLPAGNVDDEYEANVAPTSCRR